MLKHTLALVGLSLIILSANAALIDRGGGMIYDDQLKITWLQNANYAAKQYKDTDGREGSENGKMTWEDARDWAKNLSYEDYNDWRLPEAKLMNSDRYCRANDGSCDMGYNNTTGELGHMFYNNLEYLGSVDVNGKALESGYGVQKDVKNVASVSIENLQSGPYWLSDEHHSGSVAWKFRTDIGWQGISNMSLKHYSWAVRAGDVQPVPVPEAAWLFGMGLISLVGMKRGYR